MQVEPFTVELSPPLETARGTVREREGFLVTVEYAGSTGVGEATPLAGWTESHRECRRALDRAGAVAEELDWGVALGKLKTPAARHALSLALADARARDTGEPLYQTLGDTGPVDQVPVYATLGADGGPEAAAEQARGAVDAGYRCLTVTVEGRGVEADLERVRAVREAVGDAVDLRVDAGAAWTRGEARQAVKGLAALGVDCVEQPVPTAAFEAAAALRGQGVAIALDESLAAYDVETALDAGAADRLVLKPMVVGGPDLTARAARLCRDSGVEPVVSTTVEAVVARTGAVHVAASVPDVGPCGLATGDRLVRDLAPDPAPVADGAIGVPQTPGLGVTAP